MSLHLLILLWSISIINGRHFNGGTISWAPINPYSNSSPVDVTITQSYSWAYPTITCATNVPITTSGRSGANWNLTCVVDCTTDGGYSTKPIDVLTDCQTVSTSLGMMSSVRSRNLSLNAGTHFYLANVGSSWVSLNYPTQSGLEWSIVTFIDLRKRPDGFINTPPVASVVSPQYAIVNRTMQINIPVSDANAGDDVRCRWSTYTPGYRRRKRSNEEDHKILPKDVETIHIRKKRACTGPCWGSCPCTDSGCIGTNCGSGTCGQIVCAATTAASTSNTPSTTIISTTTIETQGTVRSTSSYPYRQAIDECGGICYPGSVPSGTTLSNCTISFTGLIGGVWYAVAIQVEDFINENSTTAMSSVPVQMLIYVMPAPFCSNAPVILPLNGCSEVQVGVTISFDLYAMNLCDPSIVKLTDIVVSPRINGMVNGNLTTSSTNSSLSYIPFTWTPQSNQIGSQQMCAVAYTDEQVQSTQYCVTFTVKASSNLCVTTTTTTTISTTTSKTTTSSTTSTASTASSTTSFLSSISTSFTSISTPSSSTTITSVTNATATVISATTTMVTTTEASESSTNWPLATVVSLLVLLLGLLLISCCCCCCYCLYRFYWSPAARRRRRKDREIDEDEQAFGSHYVFNKAQKTTGSIRPELSSISTLPKTNTSRINVTKVSRNRTIENKWSLSPNITGKKVMNSKTVSHTRDTKTKTINGITVAKFPQTSISTRSQHS